MTSKYEAELQSRVNSQMLIIDALREENKRLKEGTEVANLQKRIRELDKKLNSILYKELKGSNSISSIPSDMLKRLKQLAHPDKHGNSELSNTVMKFLNSL